jgi:hypothetical protein
MKSRLVKILRGISGFFPKKLPVGRTEFDSFCCFLFDTYGLPDNPSHRHAIAGMVLQLESTTCKKAPVFFAKSIRKAQANEVAYSVIQEIRNQEKTEAKKAAEKQSQEEAAPNVHSLPNKANGPAQEQ